MNKLLLNEPPLIILPSLASVLGLNEAIFLQQLHYWLLKSTTLFDGKKWVYKTVEEWEKEFPFWSDSTIKRAVGSLKKRGVLMVKKLSENKRKRVNYYSISYDNLGQIDPIQQVKLNQCHQVNVTSCIYENQETTTEITTESKKNYKKKSKKISWDEVADKEEVLAEIKKVESPLLPLEQFVNSLLQHGYRYVDFKKAYLVWVSRAKNRTEEKNSKSQLTATQIIAMKKEELGL